MQLTVWKKLLSFRPNAAIQQAVKGGGWLVHRVESGSSYHLLSPTRPSARRVEFCLFECGL